MMSCLSGFACIILAAVEWMLLTGPGGQTIQLNPDHIVSTRPPRGNEHFHKDIHCLIHTTDGKLVTVQETCERVQELREDIEP